MKQSAWKSRCILGASTPPSLARCLSSNNSNVVQKRWKDFDKNFALHIQHRLIPTSIQNIISITNNKLLAKMHLTGVKAFIFVTKEITWSVSTWMSLPNCRRKQRFLHRYWLKHAKIFEISWFFTLLTSELIVLTSLLSILSNHLTFPIMTHMLDQLEVESLMPREYEYLHHVLLTSGHRVNSSFRSL